MKYLPACELDMLDHAVTVASELIEVQERLTFTKSGAIWGYGDDFDRWIDLSEADAAFEEFEPCQWWQDDTSSWDVPRREPPL